MTATNRAYQNVTSKNIARTAAILPCMVKKTQQTETRSRNTYLRTVITIIPQEVAFHFPKS